MPLEDAHQSAQRKPGDRADRRAQQGIVAVARAEHDEASHGDADDAAQKRSIRGVAHDVACRSRRLGCVEQAEHEAETCTRQGPDTRGEQVAPPWLYRMGVVEELPARHGYRGPVGCRSRPRARPVRRSPSAETGTLPMARRRVWNALVQSIGVTVGGVLVLGFGDGNDALLGAAIGAVSGFALGGLVGILEGHRHPRDRSFQAGLSTQSDVAGRRDYGPSLSGRF